MIKTTLEITFSDDNFAGVAVETNADGELKLQAELISFAHLAATVISSLGRERARALVQSLADGGFADDELRLDGSSGGMLWIAASFVDARRGPRLFFELKPRDLRRVGKDPDVLGARSVLEVVRALAGNRRGDAETAARVRAALAERPVRPAVLRELRSRSLVPCRPSAPVCSRRGVERIGEIARRPEGSLEECAERD